MAGKLQSCRFVVLVLFLGFVMVFSTIKARTLHAPNYNHAMIKPMSPSQAKQGHYFVEVLHLWLWGIKQKHAPRPPSSGGPSEGEGH